MFNLLLYDALAFSKKDKRVKAFQPPWYKMLNM